MKESQEYRNYLEKRDRVRDKPESRKILEDFRQKQMRIHTAQLMGQSVDERSQKEVEELYHVVALNPRLKEFIEAEARVIQMISDVQKILGQALDLTFSEEDWDQGGGDNETDAGFEAGEEGAGPGSGAGDG